MINDVTVSILLAAATNWMASVSKILFLKRIEKTRKIDGSRLERR